ncbi:MAG: diguanylate cyclase, partial [Solirubrobacteraceae bacterium]
RELRVEAVSALTFAIVAVAFAALVPSDRTLDPGVALALIACHAVASRVRLYVGAGFSMPTQLVLVPMLFLLPAPIVPLSVACGLVLASLADGAGGRAHPERVLTSLADAWHAVAPAVVVVVAGEPAADWSALPVVAVALAAQCATDLLVSTAREWLGRGIPPAAMLRVMGAVYLVDVALTPLGFWAAGRQHRFAFLGVLPLIALFAALAFDRRARIEEAVGRLEQLQAEHARLDRAIRRIGEAFASKLDRDALADLMLRTAVEAVDAEHGRARLETRTITTGEPAAAVLEEAERAAQRDGRLWMTAAAGDVAMAVPLRGGSAADLVAVGRRGAPFAPEEQALFGYLAQQTAAALENVALHDRLRWQATVDELTGLANHRSFQDSLAAEITRLGRFPRPLALAILDIDDFKAINDTYGHQQGDEVLRAVAGVVRRACRATDEPARYGGEELAVVLPQTDLDGAYRFAERVRTALEALRIPRLDGVGHLRVTASFGAAALPGTGEDKASLIAAADAALYRAKRAGRNLTVRAEKQPREPLVAE